jgi:hypothetical protein
LFTFGIFSKITEEAQIIGPFFHSTIYALILTNHGLGYILGDFLQTHLVTLVTAPSRKGNVGNVAR